MLKINIFFMLFTSKKTAFHKNQEKIFLVRFSTKNKSVNLSFKIKLPQKSRVIPKRNCIFIYAFEPFGIAFFFRFVSMVHFH